MFVAAHRLRPVSAVLAALAALTPPDIASAQKLLVNGSYESPVPPNGNDFYVSIPGWTIFNISPARP